MGRFAAVDLGASNGRVMLGVVGDGALEVTEAHRFPNEPVSVGGTLYWDVLALFRGVLEGLGSVGRRTTHRLTSVGIDTWAVDYGLLDSAGALLGNPVHYRDTRTEGIAEQVRTRVTSQELYRVTGLQFLPFNTVYQLVAAADTPQLQAADQLLMLPDLLTFWLTGSRGTESTNASTTQLYDVNTGDWAYELMDRLGIPRRLFAPLREPGTVAGEILPAVRSSIAMSEPVPVVAVGSHDTASAVVATPAQDEHFAYISCGTWSLVGVELDSPVLTEASRLANFTNERGVDNTNRYLRNVMGLWLLQESLRTWRAAGVTADLENLLRDAARSPELAAVIDPDDPVFLAPGDMPRRIVDACRRSGQHVPQEPAELVRCIMDSLALAHRAAIEKAQELSSAQVDVVHVVGGGAGNELLCQLTADACGVPVDAGPLEATAIGNILVQARTAQLVGPDVAAMRKLVRETHPIERYEPRGDTGKWRDAAARLPRPAT